MADANRPVAASSLRRLRHACMPQANRRAIMNEDQVKGVREKVKGKINEGVGKG